MKKKNYILIVIVAILLVIAGILIGNNRYLSSLRGEAYDFTVYDTASITKLFFADKSGHSVLLQRDGNSWLINNEYKANMNMVNEMLYTLNRMRIKMPVSIKQSDNIVARMSSTNTKVEVYQIVPRINLFNKVKMFFHETRSKVFYIGDVTQDNQGTYVLKEGGDKVYVAHLPGLRGTLSPRFTANPIDWRDHRIFADNMDDIAAVKLEINGDPHNSYIINQLGRAQFTMTRLDGEPVEYSDNKVLALMMEFKDVRFEAFLDDIEPARRDSIVNSPFQQRLTITTKDGKDISVTTYRLMANSDVFDYSDEDLEKFEGMIKDPDHQYALLSEGNEFVLIQKFVFGKLLKPADYYSKNYKDEFEHIYYKELETIESR